MAVIIVVLCSFVSIVLAPESTGSWPRDRWAPLEHTWSQDLLKVSLSFFIAVSFISGKIWKSYIRNGKFASDERYVKTHVCKWGQGFKIPLLWQMSQAPHRGLTIYHAWQHILSETDRVVCQELYWRELLIGKCGCIAQAEIWTWTSRDFTQNKLNSSAVIVEETQPRSLRARPALVPAGKSVGSGRRCSWFSAREHRALACLTPMAFIVPAKACCQLVRHSSFDSVIHSLPRQLFYDRLVIIANTG